MSLQMVRFQSFLWPRIVLLYHLGGFSFQVGDPSNILACSPRTISTSALPRPPAPTTTHCEFHLFQAATRQLLPPISFLQGPI